MIKKDRRSLEKNFKEVAFDEESTQTIKLPISNPYLAEPPTEKIEPQKLLNLKKELKKETINPPPLIQNSKLNIDILESNSERLQLSPNLEDDDDDDEQQRLSFYQEEAKLGTDRLRIAKENIDLPQVKEERLQFKEEKKRVKLSYDEFEKLKAKQLQSQKNEGFWFEDETTRKILLPNGKNQEFDFLADEEETTSFQYLWGSQFNKEKSLKKSNQVDTKKIIIQERNEWNSESLRTPESNWKRGANYSLKTFLADNDSEKEEKSEETYLSKRPHFSLKTFLTQTISPRKITERLLHRKKRK